MKREMQRVRKRDGQRDIFSEVAWMAYTSECSVCVCVEGLCMITFSLVWSSTSSGEKLIGSV